MSIYKFTPSYQYHMGHNPYVSWQGAFSAEEVAQIIEDCGKLPEQKALIGKVNDPQEDISYYRRSRVSWVKQVDCPWMYDRLAWICQQLNGKFYDFDLWGFAEDMQYTIYDGSEQGYYDWHVDAGEHVIDNVDQRLPRKFSMVVQLSDPDEYEGGQLQLLNGKDPMVAPSDKGLVVAFPSYTLHRVTPIEKGVRRTLVVWVTGPKFR